MLNVSITQSARATQTHPPFHDSFRYTTIASQMQRYLSLSDQAAAVHVDTRHRSLILSVWLDAGPG